MTTHLVIDASHFLPSKFVVILFYIDFKVFFSTFLQKHVIFLYD